jgi:hypothetical protein
MRETIMLLSGPGAGFNVVDTRDVRSPACFTCHLVELRVLHHHGMDDTQEALVARKDTGSSSQGVSS